MRSDLALTLSRIDPGLLSRTDPPTSVIVIDVRSDRVRVHGGSTGIAKYDLS
jgi:hypothetical protein